MEPTPAERDSLRAAQIPLPDAVTHLANWFRTAPRGLALAVCEDAATRDALREGLLVELQNLGWCNVPTGTPQAVTDSILEFHQERENVAFSLPWRLFMDDPEALRTLNYNRETLTSSGGRQLWVVSPGLRRALLEVAYDLYSWFLPVVEVAAVPVLDTIGKPDFASESDAPGLSVSDARRLSNASFARFRNWSGNRESIPWEIFAEALHALGRAGLGGEAVTRWNDGLSLLEAKFGVPGLQLTSEIHDGRTLFVIANAIQDGGAERPGRDLQLLAVAAYRRALELRTRESDPTSWARTQDNLGIVLQRLGQRMNDSEMLQAAAEAFRSALQVRTRESVPAEWAMTQHNLGAVLRTLSERANDPQLLQESMDAYQSALAVRTRESGMVEWAQTQNNLGNVLRALGERTNDPERLQAAASAFRSALEVRTQESLPAEWAGTHNNLGLVLMNLGERTNNIALLREAVESFQKAFEVLTRESLPAGWAMTQNNMGNVLRTLSQQTNDSNLLREAVEAYRRSAEILTRESLPARWAQTQNNLGTVLLRLARHDSNPNLAAEAATAFRGSWEVYKTNGQTRYAPYFEKQISEAEALIALLSQPDEKEPIDGSFKDDAPGSPSREETTLWR